MSGFVVDTESLVDVANSLQTLQHVLSAISAGDVTDSGAELGGQTIGQQLGAFNTQWQTGVTMISGEVQTMTLALFKAAAHYDHTEQAVAGSHKTPQGAGPVIGGAQSAHGTTHAHTHPKPKRGNHTEHHEPATDHRHHERGTGTGTTTIGGPRMPGSGAGTTTIGGPPERHRRKGSGSGTATMTIGPGGTSVQTGPGRGYGTTTIGPDDEGDGDVTPAAAGAR
jgi:hypothetical protein